eukprot:7848650-Alexandrium_andersonii.AAC.1
MALARGMKPRVCRTGRSTGPWLSEWAALAGDAHCVLLFTHFVAVVGGGPNGSHSACWWCLCCRTA